MGRACDRYVVLLGPNAALCERARARGLGVIVVDNQASLAPGVVGLADHVLLTDYTDTGLVTDIIANFGRRFDLVGVLSLTEKGLLPQAILNAVLGYADNDVAAVRRVVDKGRMRARLAGDPQLAVPFRVADDAQAVTGFAAQAGFPVIVKPVDGAASVGVRLLETQADIDRADAVIRFPVLAETFYAGREYSAEAWSYDGHHHIVAITEKTLFGDGAGRFVEAGHCVPAPIAPVERERIARCVCACLCMLGIRWGLTHTEVIVTDERMVIVETHTRNGGDHIVDLVRQAYDVDLLDIAIAIRCGQEPPERAGDTPNHAAAIRYFTAPAGTLCGIEGLATARTSPGVVDLHLDVHPSDHIGDITSSGTRIGYVMTIGQTPNEAISLADQAAANVQFDIPQADTPSLHPQK